MFYLIQFAFTVCVLFLLYFLGERRPRIRIEGKVITPPQQSSITCYRWHLILFELFINFLPIILFGSALLIFTLRRFVSPKNWDMVSLIVPLTLFLILSLMTILCFRFNAMASILGFLVPGFWKQPAPTFLEFLARLTILPVQDFIVEDQDGNRFQVRMEGRIVGPGQISVNHRVAREGVYSAESSCVRLLFKRGRDKTVDTKIRTSILPVER